MAKYQLNRKEDPSGNTEPIEIEVEVSDGGFLEIKVKGYGEPDGEPGCPVALEHYQGKLQVLVFDDINDRRSNPQVIDLENAKEDRRSP